MKKKLIAILITVVIAAASFAGCDLPKVKMDNVNFKQDYEHIVRSNGGMSVQYGEFVYFINGNRGHEDEDAKQNVYGEVVKGGLYKAKLNGNADARDFVAEKDPETGLNFYTKKGNLYADVVSDEDYTEAELKEKEVDIVQVDVVAPKTIGTSGYAAGGVFIYDDHVYYASPNNTKGRDGKTQVTKTDFMRTKLDGSYSQLIFTTEGESATKPYAFYKQNGAVYLVCYYDTTVVSVRMPENSKKVEKAMKITDEATSVMLGVRDVYDSKDIRENDPEDFIYFTRAIKEGDIKRAGNVVVACRPDGSESFNVFETGYEITLDAVKDGGLFYHYTNTNSGDVYVEFDNLHTKLMEHSATYKAYENDPKTVDKRTEYDNIAAKSKQIYSGTSTEFGNFTSKYFFRPGGIFSDECYMLASTSSATYLRSNNILNNKKVLSSGSELHFIHNNKMYYNISGGSSTEVYSSDLYVSVDNKPAPVRITETTIISSAYKTDFVAGHIIFLAYVDEWATAYPKFKDLTVEGGKEFFAFKRSDADTKPDEE